MQQFVILELKSYLALVNSWFYLSVQKGLLQSISNQICCSDLIFWHLCNNPQLNFVKKVMHLRRKIYILGNMRNNLTLTLNSF